MGGGREGGRKEWGKGEREGERNGGRERGRKKWGEGEREE